MLDKSTAILLNTLNDFNDDGTYVVLNMQDLISGFKKKKQPDQDALDEMIKYLSEREYIKLKHSNEGKYCLTVLPKGRLFNENKKEEKLRLKKENARQIIFLLRITIVSAFASFLGAILGILFMNYIM